MQLNVTHTAIIGGKFSVDSIADVMFYDWTTSAWTPDLLCKHQGENTFAPPLETPV